MHLLLPYAGCDDPGCRQALAGLRLPHLTQLLARLTPATAPPAATGLALPHERALAQVLGLPSDAPPWAAWQAQALKLPEATTQGWAFITPCHWQVGQAQVTLLDPAELALDEAESQDLRAVMQPYFEEDGITLMADTPGRWLARGEVFRALATAAPERAIGRDVAPWLPAHPMLRRLQNEMQMLLYTHPVNEARTQRRALSVNSFWISGSGAQNTTPPPAGPAPLVPTALQQAALRQDWALWAQAWQALDAQALAELLARHAQGQTVRLTLCGERQTLDWVSQPLPRWRQWLRRWRGPSIPAILGSL